MIHVKSMFRPQYSLLVIFIAQILIYQLYARQIINSYKINFISESVSGYVHMCIFYLIPVIIASLVRKTPEKNALTLTCVNEKRILRIIYFCITLTTIGMMRVGAILFSNFGLVQTLKLSFTGESRNYLVTGSGNTILAIFGLMSMILIGIIYRKKCGKHKMLFIINFLLLFMYSSILNSRILLIEGIFFFAVIMYRRFYYQKKISYKKLIFFASIGMIFLILTSGYRDYDNEGKYYTSSILDWGISRISDYSISTTNYSLEVANYADVSESTFPMNTFPIVDRLFNINNNFEVLNLANTTGSAEYTNKGAFAQIFMDYKYYYLVFMIFLALIYAVTWKKYDKGALIGYFIYPLIIYNIFESSRIFYLGTVEAEMLFIVSLFIYLICKKSFRTGTTVTA